LTDSLKNAQAAAHNALLDSPGMNIIGPNFAPASRAIACRVDAPMRNAEAAIVL